MYLLVNKNNVIVYITTTAVLKSDGIHVGGNLVFADKSLKIIMVDELPNDIVPQKYCYDKENGFYINTSYTDIGSDNEIINDKLKYILNKIDPTVDENALTLDEMKKLQVSRVGAQCKNVIDQGVTVELPSGPEHFSLTIEDQNNINKLAFSVKEGVRFVPYHSDTTQCKIYSAEEIYQIARETDMFILYNTTYCNSINTWIRRCETKEDVQEIYFGADLPENLQNDLDKIMKVVMEELQRMQSL